nr:succinylglutamate-semialdehyde dehydrogenase [Sneathiella glossodoripedis]
MNYGQLYINGDWRQGTGGKLESRNPVNHDIILSGNSASTSDVEQAIDAASNAFRDWALTSVQNRIEILKSYQKALQDASDELAHLISSETGKVLWEAKTEVGTMVGKIDLSIKAYNDRTGTKSSENSGVISHLTHKPHGVLAVFGPFNFPGHLPNGHIVPALLAGNTIIFKPSEQTPAVGEYMVRLWEKAGLPTGVLNLVQGSRECGIALSTSDKLDGLLFTGSSHTGNLLHSEFAGQPEKILALEMGGNNPLIISEVDDIPGAVYHCLQSAYITAGQRCTCARRLILPATSNREKFLKTLISAAKTIKVGPQENNEEPFYGSVISNEAADRLLEAQASLIDQGAKPLLTMQRIHANLPFLSPGILDVSDIENLPDEEYFGPLLQVIKTQSFEDSIEIANKTRFGLSAGLFSDDAEEFATFHALIKAGIVNWNRPLTGASGASLLEGLVPVEITGPVPIMPLIIALIQSHPCKHHKQTYLKLYCLELNFDASRI